MNFIIQLVLLTQFFTEAFVQIPKMSLQCDKQCRDRLEVGFDRAIQKIRNEVDAELSRVGRSADQLSRVRQPLFLGYERLCSTRYFVNFA